METSILPSPSFSLLPSSFSLPPSFFYATLLNELLEENFLPVCSCDTSLRQRNKWGNPNMGDISLKTAWKNEKNMGIVGLREKV
mmetsp:Transcript_15255/g.19359  ORF Transcript_15255/g.19359 Transcript_15255/m.19359 type:complete len:84 (-) Transcript_15255:367-618(-)